MSDIKQVTSVLELFALEKDVPSISGAQFKEMANHENVVALGTLRNTNGVVVGEVTGVKGKTYYSDVNLHHADAASAQRGNTREIQDNDEIYFAQIAKLGEGKRAFKFDKPVTYPELQKFLAEEAFKDNPELAGACGIKLKAKVEAVIRSVDGGKEFDFNGESRTANNLAEIMSKQTERRLWRVDVNGSGILCDWSKGDVATIESPSMLHIHLVTPNERTGGHMQPYASLANKDGAANPVIFHDLEIEICPVKEWKIAKSDGKGGVEFVPATPASSQTAEQVQHVKDSLQALMQFGYSK